MAGDDKETPQWGPLTKAMIVGMVKVGTPQSEICRMFGKASSTICTIVNTVVNRAALLGVDILDDRAFDESIKVSSKSMNNTFKKATPTKSPKKRTAEGDAESPTPKTPRKSKKATSKKAVESEEEDDAPPVKEEQQFYQPEETFDI